MSGIDRFADLTWKNFEAFSIALGEARQGDHVYTISYDANKPTAAYLTKDSKDQTQTVDLTFTVKRCGKAIFQHIKTAAATKQTHCTFSITNNANFRLGSRLNHSSKTIEDIPLLHGELPENFLRNTDFLNRLTRFIITQQEISWRETTPQNSNAQSTKYIFSWEPIPRSPGSYIYPLGKELDVTDR